MSEQLTLDGASIIDPLETINLIFHSVSNELEYDIKYFTVETNKKKTLYSLLLEKNLYTKTNSDFTTFIVKNRLLSEDIDLSNITDKKTVKAPKDCTEVKIDSTEHGITFLRAIVLKYAKIYMPSERFGCCHLYEKCSDEKKCIAKDKFHAKGCFYRENLENGRIFYGQNANQQL